MQTPTRIRDKRYKAHDKIEPAALTLGQYAHKWQIGRSTILNMVAAGRIKTFTFGPRTIRYENAPPSYDGEQ